MIELGTSTATTGAADAAVAKETTDQTFMADVIEASREVPVIVDFWAPWCGPCKQLGPVLEQAVADAKGAVKMVKIDIDQNQMVASQLRVQSIPTVYAFFQGQPVDAFQGAVPASEAKAFVKRLTDLAGGGGLDEALAEADTMLAAGQAEDAAQIYGAVAQEEPENGRALGGLAKAMLALGKIEDARALLAAVPEAAKDDPAVVAARSALELADAAGEAGEAAELRAKVDADPSDHQARFELATALMAAGDNAGAIDELLELFRRDREWNEAAAKTQLLKLFDSLGPKDPAAQSGRRRLSSMIFV